MLLLDSLPSRNRSQKRKTVDGYEGDVEDQYNVKKCRTLKSCKVPQQKAKNYHKNKKRAILFLLTKIALLIHTQMEIKSTVRVMNGCIPRILYIPM